MGVGDVEAGSWRLAEREAVDWRKIEDGQGKVGGLVVAPCPWRPHPPRIPRPVPVGTRWHAARAGPDTFDKRRRNGKQRAARDLERTSLLVVTRHPTDTFVSTIYAATQITRVSHTSIIIPSGSFHDLGGVVGAFTPGILGRRERENRGQKKFEEEILLPTLSAVFFATTSVLRRDIISETTTTTTITTIDGDRVMSEFSD